MSESLLLRRILLAYGRTPGVRLWRNTVGALRDSKGRWVTYGLGVGSPDIVGWRSHHGVAQFVGIECKAERGRASPEQAAFLATLLAAGGLGAVVRSVEECYPILGPPE